MTDAEVYGLVVTGFVALLIPAIFFIYAMGWR